MREGGVHRIAAGGVQHAFRFSGRAGGIEDEQRILRVDLHGRADVRNLRRLFVIVEVAALVHEFRRAGALDDDHRLHTRALRQRQIGVHLERDRLSAAQAFVGGDDDCAFAIEDAAGEAVRRETREHHRMHRADARAGQHRVGRLGDHRQVDRDPIALFDAVRLQHIGEAADLAMQLLIGDVLAVFGIIAFPDDRRLLGALRQVPVDAVGRDVERAVLEPFDVEIVRIPGDVLDPGERLDPVDALGLLRPEPFRILQRVRVHGVVFRSVDQRARLPILGNRNN